MTATRTATRPDPRRLAAATAAFLAAVALLVALYPSRARAEPTHDFVLYTNPLRLAEDSMSLGVDVRLGDQLSAGSFALVGQSEDALGVRRSIGYGLRVDYALNAPVFTNGWYIAPILMRQLVQLDRGEATVAAVELSSTSLALVAGYALHQWGDSQRFFARVGLGGSYARYDDNVDRKMLPEGEDGVLGIRGGLFLPTADLDFGYAF